MRRIAELKINPQVIWKTLGPNQYTERPLYAITIRELLQNCDDAIIASGRKDGNISFFYYEEHGWAKLKCKDNGIGMTEDIILDKFLCLGESEKPDGSTGGFGIAKAAIIGACDKWSIKSLDNYLDSDMIDKESVKKVGEIEGTEIMLEWNMNSGNKDLIPNSESILRSLMFIQYTELKSGSKIEYFVNGSNKSVDIMFDKKIIEDNRDYRVILCQTESRQYESHVIYRLNGLVQFFKSFAYDSDLFFIVDIKTDKKPQDTNYPLGPSRETIKYSLEQKIKRITEPYRINSVSGGRAFKEKVNEIMFYPGQTIGHGDNEDNNGYYYSSIPSKFDSEVLKEADGNPQSYEFIVRRVNSNAKINIYAENNTKLLYVWAKLLELGAQSVGIDKKESFGIGFILDDLTKAERYSYNDKIFYLVNPKLIPLSKPQEAIPKLIFLVAHELAHSFHANHNEEFTIQESDIFFKIYEKFADVKWIRKFMREGIY